MLESSGYYGIHAELDTGSITPQSCLNDGIQIGSRCTDGKGNLIIVDSSAPRARSSTTDGTGAEMSLRPDIVAGFAGCDMHAESARLKTVPAKECFEWTNLSSS